jgi:hypothetical protein
MNETGFYLILVCGLLGVVLSWFERRGYKVIGVSGDTFRAALYYSLNKNNLPFEEHYSEIKLTSIDVTLKYIVSPWLGMGHLKFNQKSDKTILQNIIIDMKEYYCENTIKLNNFALIFYLISSFLMLITVGAIVILLT